MSTYKIVRTLKNMTLCQLHSDLKKLIVKNDNYQLISITGIMYFTFNFLQKPQNAASSKFGGNQDLYCIIKTAQ